MADNTRCLLRNFENTELCSPMSPVLIGLQGHGGNGGRMANAAVPAEYRGELLYDTVVREEKPDVVQTLEAYAKSFGKQFTDNLSEEQTQDASRIKSLYLWSEAPGTGKTSLAAALLNEYLVANYTGHLRRNLTPPQRPCFFLDVNQLQTEYNTFNRPRVPDDIAQPAARRYYDSIEYAKHTEFAVLDDVATRSATDNFRADLHSVINYRVANRLPCVFTSNSPIEELSSPELLNDARLPDRIAEMTMPIHFSGDSYRGIR